MSIFSLLIVLSVTIDVKSQWSFAVTQADDGYFIPDWKDKGVGYSFGEDSFVTTPSGIAVADGVGGSRFASLHIAKHLTTSFAQWVFGCQYLEEPLRSKSPLCRNQEKKDEIDTIKEVMKEVMVRSLNEAKDIFKKTGDVSLDPKIADQKAIKGVTTEVMDNREDDAKDNLIKAEDASIEQQIDDHEPI